MALFAFVLELPWALGVPDDHVIATTCRLAPGAEDVEKEQPCWLRFRTVSVPSQLPLAASDLAFGSLEVEGDKEVQKSREEKVKRFIVAPCLAQKTVVAAYVPAGDPPTLESERLTLGLSAALDVLNAWLISVGVLYNDRLRPISIADLPPFVPVMPAEIESGNFRHGPSLKFGLRELADEPRSYSATEIELAERLLAIVGAGEGLASFYELIQRAGSARKAGRHREAVIDYGTAGELFITSILQGVSERRGGEGGIDTDKLKRLLEGPFKDRAIHLCHLLGVPSEVSDPESPLFFWWMHCYQQRNSIVHDGAGSMEMLSEAARVGLVQMVVDIRDAIRSDEEISDLAATIHWGTRIDETGAGTDSRPDPPPGTNDI